MVESNKLFTKISHSDEEQWFLLLVNRELINILNYQYFINVTESSILLNIFLKFVNSSSTLILSNCLLYIEIFVLCILSIIRSSVSKINHFFSKIYLNSRVLYSSIKINYFFIAFCMLQFLQLSDIEESAYSQLVNRVLGRRTKCC